MRNSPTVCAIKEILHAVRAARANRDIVARINGRLLGTSRRRSQVRLATSGRPDSPVPALPNRARASDKRIIRESGVRCQVSGVRSEPTARAHSDTWHLTPDTWKVPAFCCRAKFVCLAPASTEPGDKSPPSVAGRRGAPPDDATRQDLGSENSAPLTRRGRIPQQCCRWQLCCLACNGTTRAKASAFNVRRSCFGPSLRTPTRPVLRSLRELRRATFAPDRAEGVSQPKREARRLVEPPGIAPGSDPPISARLSP